MTQYRLFQIASPKANADALFAALEAAFEDDGLAIAITEIDEADEIFEVSLYAGDDHETVLQRMADIVATSQLNPAITTEALPDIDWVSKSLEGLKPVRAGRFLVHGSHDRARRRIGDIAIEIDAGQAFGTGHHGTTAGCLATIESVVRRENPANALDLGTGSAVLAIAIAKLSHVPVLATDIDPVATEVASANARLNGVGRWVDCVTATGFRHAAFRKHAPFDLIVANILARPLMSLAPEMARHIAPGGSIILSGILDRQRDAVVAAYANQHFRHIRTTTLEGWVTIHMKR